VHIEILNFIDCLPFIPANGTVTLRVAAAWRKTGESCSGKVDGMTNPKDGRTDKFDRRLDLDWLRIFALTVLIFFHVGMYYVSWSWHIKSSQPVVALEPLMRAFSPWRLSLLFVISGAVLALVVHNQPLAQLAKRRSWRLLIPLLFGMFVIVPPQPYYEVVEKLGYTGSGLDFYRRYLMADHSFCKDGDCLILPTWNHLWFVAYLWVYTMIAIGATAIRPGLREAVSTRLLVWLSGWRLLLVPIALLALARVFLVRIFPSTHTLIDDWYNHAQYFLCFLLGFFLISRAELRPTLIALRWTAAIVALAAIIALQIYFATYGAGRTPPEAVRIGARVLWATQQWSVVLVCIGFATLWLTHDGPVRRYLTDAIFPFYIVHQTAIIIFAVQLRSFALPVAVEAVVLVVLTLASCVLTYEVVKRVAFLRPLFGLKAFDRGPKGSG
jgi:glucans biosynthesis protein C